MGGALQLMGIMQSQQKQFGCFWKNIGPFAEDTIIFASFHLLYQYMHAWDFTIKRIGFNWSLYWSWLSMIEVSNSAGEKLHSGLTHSGAMSCAHMCIYADQSWLWKSGPLELWWWLRPRQCAYRVVVLQVVGQLPRRMVLPNLWLAISRCRVSQVGGMICQLSGTEWEMVSLSSFAMTLFLGNQSQHQLLKPVLRTWNSTMLFSCRFFNWWQKMSWCCRQSKIWLQPLKTSIFFARNRWGSQIMYTRKHGLFEGWLGGPRSLPIDHGLLRTRVKNAKCIYQNVYTNNSASGLEFV